jgi:hydroxyacylglutathione hydrolase
MIMKQQHFSVTGLHAFRDNYIWAIHSPTSSQVALVDPGDAEVCLAYLKQHKLTLAAILITHHHLDHVGGIEPLLAFCQQQQLPCPVYGPAHSNIAHISVALTNAQQILLFEQIPFNIIEVPGHTLDHIVYVNDQALFCGDTLFSGGCGRLFEGSPSQMHQALNMIKALPGTTNIYCAHEYTASNLQFALTIEPENQALIQYNQQVHALREQGIATIPSTVDLERKINPFLRCNQRDVIQQVEQLCQIKLSAEHEVFAALRTLKDNF